MKKKLALFASVFVSCILISLPSFALWSKVSPPPANIVPLAVNTTNGFYSLSVQNNTGATGVGTFTVATGASHSSPNQNVLFGGAAGNPWSTYLTIRSYTSSTDYVSTTDTPSSTFAVVMLDSFSPTVTPIGTTGYTTSWTITGTDTLGVQQVTEILGATQADSRVRVTTIVTNNGSAPTSIGIRYMWDWQIDGSDDSSIKKWVPTDPAFSNVFFEQAPPAFQYYEETNSTNLFSVYGTVNGPNSLNPAPTPPDRMNYSSWGTAYGTAWTFSVTGSNADSAVCYFWGDTQANAITINPGQSYSVTEYLTTAVTSIGGQQTSSTPIPTMNEWGIIIFAVLAGLAAVYYMRKRQKA